MTDETHPSAGRVLDHLKHILGKLQEVSKELDSWYMEIASLLGTDDPGVRELLLNLVEASLEGLGRKTPRAIGLIPTTRSEGLSPELLEWARQQFTEQEIAEGVREIRETGGRELRDFLPELEQAAGIH